MGKVGGKRAGMTRSVAPQVGFGSWFRYEVSTPGSELSLASKWAVMLCFLRECVMAMCQSYFTVR